MNLQPTTDNKQPVMLTWVGLKQTLYPYCKGKRALYDMVADLWKVSTPTPNLVNGSIVKIILPQQFKAFVELALKENG
jgi:hypothetical protein